MSRPEYQCTVRVRGDHQLRTLLTAALLALPPYNWRWVSAQLVRSAHEQDQ
jgi:hypothetical protein